MDTNRFDAVVRSLHGGSPRRHVVGMLVGGAFGTVGLLTTEAKKKKKKKKKVSLCLNGQSLTIKKSKKRRYLSQGATEGACAVSPPGFPTPRFTAPAIMP